MALIDKLNQIKSETDALLDYANDITGIADTRLGDAVKTLCDGYGQGADGVDVDIDTKSSTIPNFINGKFNFPIKSFRLKSSANNTFYAQFSNVNLLRNDAPVTAYLDAPATSKLSNSDFFRGGPALINEIVFANGVQFGGSPTRFCAECAFWNHKLTIRGISLSQFTAMTVASASTNFFEIWWIDELVNNATINVNLTEASVHDLMSKLHDYAGDTAHTLTFGANATNRPTAADIEIAAARNWTIV